MCDYIYIGYVYCKLLYFRKVFEGTMHILRNQLADMRKVFFVKDINNNNNNNKNKMCDYIYIMYIS